MGLDRKLSRHLKFALRSLSIRPQLFILISGLAILASGCGGGTSTSARTSTVATAPSSLVYPQTTIVATVGVPIAADTPTLTGTASSFSISPALPAGLALSGSSGVISGTATATAVQTSYTVTAQNSSGSTSATLQISVNQPPPPPPSSLSYSQPTITAVVGDEMMPDLPIVSGSVASFTVSPALPSGLSLDAATGVISGTPTATAPQTTYVVTAKNAGGAATTSVMITVASAPNVLLELGHGSPIQALRSEPGRVLSADQSGHWVLWDFVTAKILASGDGSPSVVSAFAAASLTIDQIDMAGPTFAIAIPGGLEVHATSDGHLTSIVSYSGLNQLPTGSTRAPWWQLASDGSYVAIGSQQGLAIFATSGQLSVSKSGDYSAAEAFAAPSQIQIALGPAGPNVIESISIADGSSSLSPQFSGQFYSWFVDGAHFLTNLSTTVWVYSSAAVQQAVVTLPTLSHLTGQGNWIWTFQTVTAGPTYPISVYAIGSEVPALTYDAGIDDQPVASGNTIGVLAGGGEQVAIIDLSGATPTETNYSTSCIGPDAYAASSGPQWMVGNYHGALADGASLATTPRYFGHGETWGIAGSSTRTAASTAIGEILVFDPSSLELEEQIGFPSGQLAMSADGTVLGASAANEGQCAPDRTLNFYSLPSGTTISSFPYTYGEGQPDLLNFSLAASATAISQNVLFPSSYGSSTGTVTGISGTPTILTTSLTGPPNDNPGILGMNPLPLSPDGTLIAENIENAGPITNIYQNGTLVTAVPGLSVGWIDNDRLLVNEYSTYNNAETEYSGAAIYSSTGTLITSLPTLPQMFFMQPVTSDSVYDLGNNTIYSLTTGQPTWTGTYPSNSGNGAVAGQYIVYQAGHRIVEEKP